MQPHRLLRPAALCLIACFAAATARAAPPRSSAVDVIRFGDDASERAHAIASVRGDVTAGALGQPARRLLPLDPPSWDGGKVAFVSDRDGMKAPRLAPTALQLFVMDDPPHPDRAERSGAEAKNPQGAREQTVEKIGYLNVGQALHPVVLRDGRIIFSSLESQGIRNGIQWGIWSIHPDGTNWEPVISAFHQANGFHFQTQLSDGSIVVENYYNQNNRGFGTHLKLPLRPPAKTPAFLPANTSGVDAEKMRMLQASGRWAPLRLPFQPYGLEVITRFATFADRSASLSDPSDPKSPRVGKVTHPSGAPDVRQLAGGGGCSSARGASALGLAIVAFALVMRRRRALPARS